MATIPEQLPLGILLLKILLVSLKDTEDTKRFLEHKKSPQRPVSRQLHLNDNAYATELAWQAGVLDDATSCATKGIKQLNPQQQELLWMPLALKKHLYLPKMIK